MANGVRLGWLVDPIEEVVWVYRTGRDAERIERPGTLGGEDVMQGFEASFERIWKKPDA